MSTESPKTLGVVAEFKDPAALLHAAEFLRDAGYRKFDCHSPFPIHGMFHAMGQRRSVLGFIIAVVAFTAMCGGLALQWWTNAIDYPFVISGKPLVSYQAYAPVGFGIAILISAVSTVVFLSLLNGMPRFHHPVFYAEGIRKASDNGFLVSILHSDPKFHETETVRQLESIGGHNIEMLKEE